MAMLMLNNQLTLRCDFDLGCYSFLSTRVEKNTNGSQKGCGYNLISVLMLLSSGVCSFY